MPAEAYTDDPYKALVVGTREIFVNDAREHEMKVLRDDGLYRHLRFGRPGSSFYRFDLVTWPGYLAIVGDCEDFVFCRDTDMFEWFAGDRRRGFDDEIWGINPGYWSQKLVAPKTAESETYSEATYRRQVLHWFEEEVDQLDIDEDQVIDAVFGFRLAVSEQLLRDSQWDDYDESSRFEDGARNRLRNFEWTPPARWEGHRPTPVRIEDVWEWSLKDFDHHFLWACWAIVWGIEHYRAAIAAPAAEVAHAG